MPGATRGQHEEGNRRKHGDESDPFQGAPRRSKLGKIPRAPRDEGWRNDDHADRVRREPGLPLVPYRGAFDRRQQPAAEQRPGRGRGEYRGGEECSAFAQRRETARGREHAPQERRADRRLDHVDGCQTQRKPGAGAE